MPGRERGEREWAGATGYQGSRLSKKNYQVSGKCVGVTNHKIFICDGRGRGRGQKEEEQQLGELAELGRGSSITWLTYLGLRYARSCLVRSPRLIVVTLRASQERLRLRLRLMAINADDLWSPYPRYPLVDLVAVNPSMWHPLGPQRFRLFCVLIFPWTQGNLWHRIRLPGGRSYSCLWGSRLATKA